MIYDMLIIGKGCAGYTAAIYGARYKLNVCIIGAEEGGMGMTAAEVGNWPGDIEVKGPDLMNRMKAHAESFDTVTSINGHVYTVVKNGNIFTASIDDAKIIEAKTILFATGSNKKHLGVPGEDEFSGKGVSYCATCDAFFFRNKTVAVIGGGDAAVEGAAIVAQSANKVYLIHRRDTFKAEPYWVDKVKEKDNIEFVLNNSVVHIKGDTAVRSIELASAYNSSTELLLDGVFIEIGASPAISLPVSLGCEIDSKGHLLVGKDQQSTVAGVFGAGDVTSASNHFAQFTTAAGEASVATNGIFNYLQTNQI